MGDKYDEEYVMRQDSIATEAENPFFESLKTGLMQAISGETREMTVSDVPNIDDGHITQGVEE